MNQRKANAFIRERLYLVDDLFVRSEKDAQALASQCTMSARALVMRAEAKSDLPEESWQGFYRALDAADRRASDSWRKKLHDALRSLRRHRRFAISTLIIVLILAFFTLVPAGRAIANDIFDYFAKVVGMQLEISQTQRQQFYDENGYDVPSTLPQEAQDALAAGEEIQMESDPVYYESVAAFETASGLDAFNLDSDQLTCTSVFDSDHLITGKTLHIIYQMQDGKNIYIMQQWFTGDGESASTGGTFKERQVLDGRTMYYTDDAPDGMFDGVVLLDTSILMISADAGVDPNFIWQFFE